MFKQPILVLIFNRPTETRQLLKELEGLQPQQLFVAGDGPRTHKAGEAAKVAETRALFDDLAWDCELKTRFLDDNLGCKHAVSTAISWFFEQVEQGIILEDDCIPNPSFFPYCAALLNRYKTNESVLHIAGSNAFPEAFAEQEAAYHYTPFTAVWGWATWRRAWEKMDLELSQLPSSPDFMQAILDKPSARQYYYDKFLAAKANKISSWAYIWQCCVFLNQGIGILPKVNLIQNIGFGEEATHTAGQHTAHIKTEALGFPLVPPTEEPRSSDAFNLAYFYKTQKRKWRLWFWYYFVRFFNK